jgi:hypothetical protein
MAQLVIDYANLSGIRQRILDSTCGKLIPCHITAREPQTTIPERQPSDINDIHRLCSGKCKPHSCDTKRFCIDDNCSALIHCPEHRVLTASCSHIGYDVL